jgi:dTDP-D-glucose 4,6-dehydratase
MPQHPNPMKLLITGAAGFIGSNLVEAMTWYEEKS